MAKMPLQAMQDDPTADPAMTDTAAPDATGGDTGPSVLLTILKNAGGGYTLVSGDENESIHDQTGDMGETPPAEGAPEADQGQTFDSIGPLLKGVLDLLKKDEDESSGEGSADDNTKAGFEGGPDDGGMSSRY